MKKTSRGMTLIEFLVVIFLLTVIAIIVYPVLFQSRGDRRKYQDLNSMKQVGIAIQMYAADNDDGFPWAKSVLDDVQISGISPLPSETKLYRLSQARRFPHSLLSYAKNDDIFWSEAAKKRFSPMAKQAMKTSMTYNGVAAAWYGKISEVEDPSKLAILLDHTAWKKSPPESHVYLVPYGLADSSARFMPTDKGAKLFQHAYFMRTLYKEYERKMFTFPPKNP